MKPLTDEQREIATRFVPLAFATAQRLRLRCGIRDRDVANELALFAVVQAAAGFNTAKNENPAGWMSYRVPQRFFTLAAKYRKAEKRNVPFARPPFDSEPERHPHDVALLVERVLSRMTPRQRAVVELVFLGGLNQTEAAERLGISQAGVSALVRSGLNRAGAELERYRQETGRGCNA